MMLGTVLRSHAGGYMVYQQDNDADLFCMARGRLKKESVSILSGDMVSLTEVNLRAGTGVISACLKRSNMLSRPALANVSQIVLVQAMRQPDWNSLWCDRHLVHFQLEVPSANFVLCFNKCDLVSPTEKFSLKNIYEPLGYQVLIVSAHTSEGVDQLKQLLQDKLTVFTGPSGVGKSSLLNVLEPSLNLKVGRMENDFGVGRHTTTAVEVYRLRGQNNQRKTWVADTPGFSVSELKHPEPRAVASLFPEIAILAKNCRYSDCLHLVEEGCNVLLHAPQLFVGRLESYNILVKEALQEQKQQTESSSKVESKVKAVGGKHGKAKAIPRLNNRYRIASRRTEKQKLMQHDLEESASDEIVSDEIGSKEVYPDGLSSDVLGKEQA